VSSLMRSGRLTGASSTALTLSEAKLQQIYDDFDYFGSRIVLRPQEISNNPTIIRQLGVIAINTALEIDIYGHVNSSHVCGTQMMNGIGGAADFERNAGLSVFVCPSIAKGGRISTIVPFCSHVDHSEHYRMHDNVGSWQISDVYMDGTISQLAIQRSEFHSILQREGVDGLIMALNRKVDLLTRSLAKAS
jgi:hypothetical protein